jgi:hypothetical protein
MFKQYAKDIYSQNGEDGIIEEILKLLAIKNSADSWCVEFGAWDGKHLSNTFNLVTQGWSSVMIEGDSAKFESLTQTAKDFQNMHIIKAYVSQYDTEDNSLDKLLKTTPIPNSFELLSIDVDSYDSDIWETLSDYSAKVVVIEINGTVPPGVYWRHKDTPVDSLSIGTTFSEMLNIAKEKEYTLVSQPGNCIFVRNDLLSLLNMPQDLIESPELLFAKEFLIN